MRISLKSSLLILAILGAGAGLLGRLFMTSPAAFFRVSWILVTVVPFLAAIVTIAWLGRKQQSRTLWSWAILLLVVPPLGAVGLGILRSVGSGSQGLGVLSNRQILTVNLPKAIDRPWVWRELERRANSGDLTSAEVDIAFQELAAHLKKQKDMSPLSWQRGFLDATQKNDLGSDKELFALCDAFYGQPKASIRGTSSVQIEYGSPWGNSLGVELLWKVNKVLVDGKPLPFKSDSHFGRQESLRFEEPLPDGKQVTVEIESVYLNSDKLIGLNLQRLDDDVIPTPARRWTQEVTLAAPKKLTNAALVTDAKRDPTSELQVVRLAVQNDPNNRGSKKFILKMNMDNALSLVDICSDVFIHIDASTMVSMGHTYGHRDKTGSRTSGSTLTGKIDRLDGDVAVVDIELDTDLDYASEQGIFKEIWGKKIMLYDVPVERLDLEAK